MHCHSSSTGIHSSMISCKRGNCWTSDLHFHVLCPICVYLTSHSCIHAHDSAATDNGTTTIVHPLSPHQDGASAEQWDVVSRGHGEAECHPAS